jgi:hypothetical protein
MVAKLLLRETKSRKPIPVSEHQHHERWLSGRVNLLFNVLWSYVKVLPKLMVNIAVGGGKVEIAEVK